MDNKRIARELLTAARELTADGLLESNSEYRKFVDGAKRFGGRYKGNGVVEFPLTGLYVDMSGNETKFYFSLGDVTWGRLWNSEDALKAVRAVENIRRKINMERM